MIGLIFDIWGWVQTLYQLLLTGGLAGLAVLAWASRFHPAVRWPLSEIAIGVCVLAAAGAAWTGSGLHHEKLAALQRAEEERDRMAAILSEQQRLQREFDLAAARQNQRALSRALSLKKTTEIADGYQDDLASGVARTCPPDDAYRDRMQSIQIGGSGSDRAAPAASGGGS